MHSATAASAKVKSTMARSCGCMDGERRTSPLPPPLQLTSTFQLVRFRLSPSKSSRHAAWASALTSPVEGVAGTEQAPHSMGNSIATR